MATSTNAILTIFQLLKDLDAYEGKVILFVQSWVWCGHIPVKLRWALTRCNYWRAEHLDVSSINRIPMIRLHELHWEVRCSGVSDNRHLRSPLKQREGIGEEEEMILKKASHSKLISGLLHPVILNYMNSSTVSYELIHMKVKDYIEIIRYLDSIIFGQDYETELLSPNKTKRVGTPTPRVFQFNQTLFTWAFRPWNANTCNLGCVSGNNSRMQNSIKECNRADNVCMCSHI